MIRKVRNEFILTAMSALTFLMILMIGSINIINHRQVNHQLDAVIEEMYIDDQLHLEGHTENPKDNYDHPLPDKILNQPENPDKKGIPGNPHPIERLYQSRYFTIRIPSGQKQDIFVTNDSISTEEAKELADQILLADQNGRKLKDYKYRIHETDLGTTIHVLDCSAENTAIRNLLWTSILIGLLGLIVIFAFIFYMSGKAVLPLQESLDKQKQFITDASHELKTPVSVISTNMEVLKMDIGPNEWIESTQRQIVKLRKLIAHLISLSRMEESVTDVQRQSFSLSDAVLDLAAVYETMAEVEGKELIKDIADDITIIAEEKSIREILTVLFENSVKYSTAGSPIRISLKREGKKVIVSTENDWEHDIEKKDLDKIFERFYRGDKSRNRDQKNNGYGLGLSIARAAANRNKGSILVEETPEGKLMFKVILASAPFHQIQ